MCPPDLTTDRARLAALAGYAILDTPPEEGFDDVVRMATQVCDTPVALVSLVAENRQWFKARVGFEPCETSLDSSVCAHALGEPDLLIITDLTLDPRTRANPLVTGAPYLRFYAGAPLCTASGHALGSLCVIDGAPRPGGLDDRQAETLRCLARQVMAQLELRRAVAHRDALIAESVQADARRGALLEIGDRLRDVATLPEMLAGASEIVGRALGVARVGFGYLDAAAETLDVVSDWTREGVPSIAGRHRLVGDGRLIGRLHDGEALVVEDVRASLLTAADPEPLVAFDVAALVNVPVRDRGGALALLIVHDLEPRVWAPEVLSFLRNVADRLEVGAARIRAEQEQALLNQELSHRMKNMMAMVQAIALQTLKAVPDKAPVEALGRRIHALAAAHDLLLRDNWTSARLDAVAAAALDAFGMPGRIFISGPEVEIGPRATLSMSMLLHEMATNAVKHGALSGDLGQVAVTWRIEAGDQPELVLDWREAGGPPACEPKGRGFGSRLINMGLVGTGGVAIRYLSQGLEAEFRATLSQVSQS